MSYQENGWPLGLRTLNFSGSFSTLFSASHLSSSVSSTDYDSESFDSVSYRRNRTLGSLIGIIANIDADRPNYQTSRVQENASTNRSPRIKDLFSLCLRRNLDINSVEKTPSLGQFLELERRASKIQENCSITL